MTTHELQQEILRLKKEKNVCILAHAYQSQAVLEVADYTGDSYGLSVQAAKTDAAGVIMCGVRFMAETCKILSPEKTVWLANPMAGCPMAEQLDLPALRALKAQYPGLRHSGLHQHDLGAENRVRCLRDLLQRCQHLPCARCR